MLIKEDITELAESLSVLDSGAGVSAKAAAVKKLTINSAGAHNVFFVICLSNLFFCRRMTAHYEWAPLGALDQLRH
jgi:hypothetical protein